jgi:hypothetical protein
MGKHRGKGQQHCTTAEEQEQQLSPPAGFPMRKLSPLTSTATPEFFLLAQLLNSFVFH